MVLYLIKTLVFALRSAQKHQGAKTQKEVSRDLEI
jgi:hypothetical protein